MKVVLFVHSLRSCWNHGNVHFLRGVVCELRRRGHVVAVHEPRDGWSARNLILDHGRLPLEEVDAAYPELGLTRGGVEPWDGSGPDLDDALDGAELVLVHEWNEPDLVAAVGRQKARGGRFRLYFHDTHHRSVTAPAELARLDLSAYDGVLAFGDAVREVWARRGWGDRAVTWHEAADVTVFRPRPAPRVGDLVWIGNWGDDERTEELREFLLEPARTAGLSGSVHGVRFPPEALAAVDAAGLAYRGWLPNHRVPEVFGAHRVTVHVPRRPYAAALPGVPTIRVFEALACGIPLVCAPWTDSEGLFAAGEDFLVARDGDELARHLRAVCADAGLASALAERGRATVLARHTVAHRVDELLALVRSPSEVA